VGSIVLIEGLSSPVIRECICLILQWLARAAEAVQ
jgi:hypothetical protein